jgi:DNA-binding Lrp family transcriptional regulator
LDRIDVAILREMTQAHLVLPARLGVSPSHREIARRLHIPSGTVRYRINRMYASRVVTGSSVFPNPSLLGLKAGAYIVDVSPLLKKTEVIRNLRRVQGAFFIHNFLGSLVWVVLFYENNTVLSRSLNSINETVGAEGFFSPIPLPQCTAFLTQKEAELLLLVSKHGFAGHRELAKFLGISIRTLSRKLSKLATKDAILSLPRINYSAIKECIPADLFILFKDLEVSRQAESRVLPLLKDYLVFAALWDVVGMCSLILPDVATVSELPERLRQLEGVSTVRLEILKERVDMAAALGEYLEKWMEAKGTNLSPLNIQHS